MPNDIFKDVRNESIDFIKQFIEMNIERDVNEKNPYGLTLLHSAAEYDSNTKIVEILISLGANVNTKEKHGLTPLHIVAVYGNVEIAKILVSGGADVNAKENNGFTPLHTAAVSKKTSNGRNIEVAKVLVSKGADTNARSNVNAKGESYSPLDLARQFEDTAMVQYLSSPNPFRRMSF